MPLSNSIAFFRRFLATPGKIGSVAPSSQALARALAAPLAARREPARVLEVGAGTGPVTRCLASLLEPQDQLDVCERDPVLCGILEQLIAASPPLSQAQQEGRLKLWRCPVQEVPSTNRYDYVISSLPFKSFQSADVEMILEGIRKKLKPGGVFSFFEYVACHKLLHVSPSPKTRRRFRAVTNLVARYARDYEIGSQFVLVNVPPARAHYWCFEPPAIWQPPKAKVQPQLTPVAQS